MQTLEADVYAVNGMLGFWEIAAASPDRVAVTDARLETVTYGELLATANRVSHACTALALRPNAVVAVMIPNEWRFLAIQFACLQSGLQMMPIDCDLSASEVANLLIDSGASLFVASHRYRTIATDAADRARIDPTRRVGTRAFDAFIALDEWLASRPATPPAAPRSGEMLWYTSGSTGRPKGVYRPLSDITPQARVRRELPAFAGFRKLMAGSGVHLAVLPIYHAGGNKQVYFALHLGYAVVLMDRVTPTGVLEHIARHRPTTTLVVPTLFTWWLEMPESVRRSYDVSSLEHVLHGAATCAVAVKREILGWFGSVIWETYGATEGGGTYVTADEWLRRPGTVGRPWPGVEMRIMDSAGNPLPPRTIGRIYFKHKGDRFEYHNDPGLTARNTCGDFFTAGDLGWVDEEGWLYLSGREVDVITLAGRRVFPDEVEHVLRQHGAVRDVVVVDLPDGRATTLCAVVHSRRDDLASDALAEELDHHCQQHLAPFKCPAVYRFEPIRRSPTGKVSRARLRDALMRDCARTGAA